MTLRLLRLAAAWTFAALYWTGFAALELLSLRRLPSSLDQRALRLWGRATLAILGLELVVENASTVEERRPRVVVFNHQSGLDMIWLMSVCPPAPLAIGKKEIVWVPVVNLAFWALDFIRVDRANPRKAVQEFDAVAKELVGRRRSLVISPEGTRTRDGSMLPFKRGAFLLAIRSRAVVSPIVVSGAFELLPRGSLLPRPGVIRLRFLPPMETAGLAEADAHALMERVRGSMAEAYASMRA